jgi:ribA/ribD-fused uncharacterized protein
MTTTVIDNFRGQYRFLSNFYVEAHGKTVEHFFQAAKTTTSLDFAYVYGADTPGEAKRRGKLIKLDPEWENIKLGVMYALVKEKFEDEELRDLLLATGDAELIEGNTWCDNYWGNCTCRRCGHNPGENHLGKILMRVRGELTGSTK